MTRPSLASLKRVRLPRTEAAGRSAGHLAIAWALTILLGCEGPDAIIPLVEVKPADQVITVQGRGELIASESIPITLPDDVRMWFNIAWMIPEYSEVSAGDVVARFDDSQVRVDRDSSRLEVTSSELQLEIYERTSAIDRTQISHEADRVVGEVDIAQNFVEVDPMLFSRNEIIDALGDLDYLGVEGAYYEWQADTHLRRTDAERDRIAAGRRASELKLEKQDAALEMMELRSPEAGTFVYARTPWGQKLTRGQQIFAGRPVGFLPVRGKVRARVFVAETEAVDLEVGQSVQVRLDSAVAEQFPATVVSVSPVAMPRHREDPQKYFVVEAELAVVEPDLMRVGSSLTATIRTGVVEGALLVPQQAVFFDQDVPFVYVIGVNGVERRPVSIGRRGPNRVEITHGLVPGDRVSVVVPTAGAG